MLVLHQLSVSDRYFCQARQEVRLLSLSHGPCHLGLLFYRCSIKGSQRNHPAFLWLKLVSGFTSIPSLLLSSLDSPPSLLIPQRGQQGSPGRAGARAQWAHCHAIKTASMLGRPQTRHHICISPSCTIWKVQKRRCWRGR